MSMGTPFQIGTFSAIGTISVPFVGVVRDDRIVAIRAFANCVKRLARIDSLLELLEDWEATVDALEEAIACTWLDVAASELSAPLSAFRVHAPLLPRQIFCIGANYKSHVVQMLTSQPDTSLEASSPADRRAAVSKMMDERAANGKPYAFLKSSGAVTGPFDDVRLPLDVLQPDWELELALIIGRDAYRVTEAQALQCIAGYAIANDITARDWIYRHDIKAVGTDWIAGKSRPTFLPFGPWIVPARFIQDPQKLRITLRLNGEVMQDESTSDMLFSVARQISYLSSLLPLQPGDVICTGSPAGNGTHHQRFLRPGDVMEGSITGLGWIRNHCIAE
jgi:2,4-diketo-3-deoxy-L-fuconate hydrolase